MRDRGRGAPLDHECANPAVGEDLQGMAVVMRQRLTPQSPAYSIDYLLIHESPLTDALFLLVSKSDEVTTT